MLTTSSVAWVGLGFFLTYPRLRTENENELEGEGLEDCLFSVRLCSWVSSSDDTHQNLTFFNLLSIPPRRSASTAFPSIQPFIFCALRYMIVTLIALVYPSLCYSSLASFVAANSSPPFRSLSLPFPCFSMTSFPYVDPSIPHASPFNIHDRMSYVPQLLRSFSPKSAVLPHHHISVSAVPRSSGAPMYRSLGLRDDCIYLLNAKRLSYSRLGRLHSSDPRLHRSSRLFSPPPLIRMEIACLYVATQRGDL